MKKPTGYSSFSRTRRLLALLAALSTSMILTTPRMAEALTWEITTYYFDAAKTQVAGRCWVNKFCIEGNNGCTGTTPTPYYNVGVSGC